MRDAVRDATRDVMREDVMSEEWRKKGRKKWKEMSGREKQRNKGVWEKGKRETRFISSPAKRLMRQIRLYVGVGVIDSSNCILGNSCFIAYFSLASRPLVIKECEERRKLVISGSSHPSIHFSPFLLPGLFFLLQSLLLPSGNTHTYYTLTL